MRALDRYPRAKEIISILRKPHVVVEQELAKLQKEARTFPQRHKQLAAIRYYLHCVVWECEMRWQERHRGSTNHATLIDAIEYWRHPRGEPVCFVTFNYDRMIESALSQVFNLSLADMESYVRLGAYSVIKLHGSVNWGHEVKVTSAEHTYNESRLIDEVETLMIDSQYVLVKECPMTMVGGRWVVPALAIPVDKKDEFVCPQSHIDVLERALPDVTKIIVIGWRATEAEFLAMLRDKLTVKPDLLVVSGDANGAKQTVGNLVQSGVVPEGYTCIEDGFSGLIRQMGYLEQFLRR